MTSSAKTSMQSTHIGKIITPFACLTAFAVPQLARRLISWGKLDQQGAEMTLSNNRLQIRLQIGSIIWVQKKGNL